MTVRDTNDYNDKLSLFFKFNFKGYNLRDYQSCVVFLQFSWFYLKLVYIQDLNQNPRCKRLTTLNAGV